MQFCKEQMNAVSHQEDDNYLWQITNQIKNDKRLTLPDEDINKLFRRLKETYNYLIALGFTKKALIEAFLYGEAVTPGYKNNPIIKDWIEKKDHIPEQQYEDLLIIVEKKQKGLL
ncbi:hypothetical protein A9G24_10605 [Gilliamella sp. App6-5]|uniref:hypothetical protein n=1 Tax=Gilliamella sp. App6-5 TaxID=3120232 RepID=UPI00080E1B6C|nr:hypothetical protein [Gilliamella apicola]OCG10165.1 hypothetical protein A9G24_10605 [Gilliamella apicola]